MRFSPEFIEKVREANNIVDVISQHVQLKRAGSGLSGLCPFHNERSPSFSVSEEKQLYHCFGCGASGNIYSFLQNYRGLSFPESVEFLAEKAAISIPKEPIDSRPRANTDRDKQKTMWKINAIAVQFYQSQLAKLAKSHPVSQYVEKRKLNAEVLEKFKIGYAPSEWEGLAQVLSSKGAPMPVAAELGLVKARQGGNGFYDVFRDRLMFPIHSPMGNAVGFGGRVLGDELPKYRNSSDSEVFHKGKVFYGLDETAKFIRAADAVIVVEGYMDFLALYQAGFTNVVASLGTALTPDHAKLLKRYTKNIFILFDGDSAGQMAAERSLPILLAQGLFPRGLTLPEGLDPDDFLVQRGPEALKKILNDAPELFVLIMKAKFQGLSSGASSRIALIDDLAPVLAVIPDSRLKTLYSEWLCDMFGAEKNWAKGALSKAFATLAQAQASGPSAGGAGAAATSRPQGPQGSASSKGQPMASFGSPQESKPVPKEAETATGRSIIKVAKPPRAELELLNVALMREEYFKHVWQSEVVPQITNLGIREIFLRAEELYRQMPSKFDNLTALLVAEVEPSNVLTMYLQKPLSDLTPGGAKKLIEDCIRRIRESAIRLQTKELVASLRGESSEEQLQKLEQIMNIQKVRRSLTRDPEPS